MDMLIHATQNEYPKSEKVAEMAVRNRHMEMLVHATQNEYPKSERVRQMQEWEMYVYAIDNGYP